MFFLGVMQSALLSLYTLQKNCDVFFVTADDVKIGAHKVVLSACSDVLDAMLEHVC
jgi:hypothetical protein